MTGSLVAALCVVFCSCKAYDGSKLEPDEGATAGEAGASGQGGSGGAGTGPAICIETVESCNAVDDDCDGMVDEATAGICSDVILNAVARCTLYDAGAVCVTVECLPGFDNCDGEPANGCEAPHCACNRCEDAGAGDAGDSDDAGGDDAGSTD